MSNDQDTTAPGKVAITIKRLPPRITVRRGDCSDPAEARRLIAILESTGWRTIEETTDGSLCADHVPAKTILEFRGRSDGAV